MMTFSGRAEVSDTYDSLVSGRDDYHCSPLPARIDVDSTETPPPKGPKCITGPIRV